LARPARLFVGIPRESAGPCERYSGWHWTPIYMRYRFTPAATGRRRGDPATGKNQESQYEA